MENKQQVIKQYTPNLLIKIGVSLNILFAALLSLLYFTLILTIPIIALSIYILVPRTQVNKYFGVARIFTVVLSVILTLIVLLVIIFAANGVIDIYNRIADSVNYIVFWNNRTVMSAISDGTKTNGLKAFEIIFSIIGFSGPVFISIGWYNKTELSVVNKPVNEKKKKEKVKNDDRKNK